MSFPVGLAGCDAKPLETCIRTNTSVPNTNGHKNHKDDLKIPLQKTLKLPEIYPRSDTGRGRPVEIDRNGSVSTTRGAGSKDLGDGRGFGGCEVGAEEGETGSEVPRRRHPCSLARSAAAETETLGCGWMEIGDEAAGEMVLRSARKKREATLCPRGVGGSGQ